jgi:hypothetical protein
MCLAPSVSLPDAGSFDEGKTNSKFAANSPKTKTIAIDMLLEIGLVERAMHPVTKSVR